MEEENETIKKIQERNLNGLIKKVWECSNLNTCEKAIIDTTLNERFKIK